MKRQVYLETTIVSYLAAHPSRDLIRAAHQQITRDWWENRRGEFDLYVSQLVVQESEGGDADAAARRLVFLEGIPLLPFSDRAVSLGEALIEAGALPKRAAADALHIAQAAVHGIDFLLTWNCNHLANAELIGPIGDIIKTRGDIPPVICTPEELMGE